MCPNIVFFLKLCHSMFVTNANDTWNTHEIPRHCNYIINLDVIMWFYCTVTWNKVTAMSLLRPFRIWQHMRTWFLDTTAAISCSWEITYWHDLIGQDDSGKVRLGNIVRPFIICHRSLVCSCFQTNVTWCLSSARTGKGVEISFSATVVNRGQQENVDSPQTNPDIISFLC